MVKEPKVKICICNKQFFPSMFFAAKPQKKTSIDGLKWRDLVGVVVGR